MRVSLIFLSSVDIRNANILLSIFLVFIFINSNAIIYQFLPVILNFLNRVLKYLISNNAVRLPTAVIRYPEGLLTTLSPPLTCQLPCLPSPRALPLFSALESLLASQQPKVVNLSSKKII